MTHMRLPRRSFSLAEARLICQFGSGNELPAEGELRNQRYIEGGGKAKLDGDAKAKQEMEKSIKLFETNRGREQALPLHERIGFLSDANSPNYVRELTEQFEKDVAPHNKSARADIYDVQTKINAIRRPGAPSPESIKEFQERKRENALADDVVEGVRFGTGIGALGPHESTPTRMRLPRQSGYDVVSGDELENKDRKSKADTAAQEAVAKDILVFAPANAESATKGGAPAAKLGTEAVAKAGDDEEAKKSAQERKFETGSHAV